MWVWSSNNTIDSSQPAQGRSRRAQCGCGLVQWKLVQASSGSAPAVHQPTVEVHQPAVEVHKPAVEVHKPAVEVHKPAVEVHKPAVEVHKPAVEVHKPAGSAQASSGSAQASTWEEQDSMMWVWYSTVTRELHNGVMLIFELFDREICFQHPMDSTHYVLFVIVFLMFCPVYQCSSQLISHIRTVRKSLTLGQFRGCYSRRSAKMV